MADTSFGTQEFERLYGDTLLKGEKIMKCPECGDKLLKENHHGTNVRSCKNCGTVWFILRLKKGNEKSAYFHCERKKLDASVS